MLKTINQVFVVGVMLSGLLLMSAAACLAAETDRVVDAGTGGLMSSPPTEDVYEYGQRTRDGIGKFYLGREISLVMGHLGADWLERRDRKRQERTDLLIKSLPLSHDSVVADIGAGTGYFSFPIARRVPEGRVIAVDIQPEMLDMIEQRREQSGVTNVETLLGSERDPGLPANAVDLILLVDAYHEFSYPAEMGQAMARALKPGGVLVLIEYRAEDPDVPIKPLHKMSEEQARREMAAAGLEWETTKGYLPQQHFMIFSKPDPEDLQTPDVNPGD